MSRKHPNTPPSSPFKRLLGWTLLLALVFSAGLITGERILRNRTVEALVAVDDQVVELPPDEVAGEDKPEKPRSFAFFDQLTQKAQVSLSSTHRAQPAKVDSKPEREAPAKKEVAPPSEAKAAAKKEVSKPEVAAESKAGESQPDKAHEPAKPQPEQAPARFTLQVAAHPDLDGAKEHMERLRAMGLEPQLVSAAIPGKGTFYRVRVGKFATNKQAQSFQEKLKSDHSLSTFVSPL